MAKRRARKGSYKLTSKRRVALKRAQAISAQKRKGHGVGNAKTYNTSGRKMNTAAMGGKRRKSNLGRNIAIGAVGVTAITTAGVVARHKLSGSSISIKENAIVGQSGNVVPGRKTAEFHISRDRVTGNRFLTVYSKKSGPLGSSKRLEYMHSPLPIKKLMGDRIRGKKELTAQPFFESTASEYVPEKVDLNLRTGKGTGKTLNARPVMDSHGNVKVPGMTKGNWGSYGKRIPGISGTKDPFAESAEAAKSRIQDTKQYRGKGISGRLSRPATVNGVPLDQYLNSLKGKYPRAYS